MSIKEKMEEGWFVSIINVNLARWVNVCKFCEDITIAILPNPSRFKLVVISIAMPERNKIQSKENGSNTDSERPPR